MDGIIFGIFTISIVIFISAIYHLLMVKKPGFYPPKPVLKRRAFMLMIGAFVFLIFGLLLSIF